MKTWNAKTEEVQRSWWIIDATDKTLGRLATEVAQVLRGKNKPIFTPHVDTGDFVIITNSKKVVTSGNKLLEKKYYRHSGFFGGIKETTLNELMNKDSNSVVTHAVQGMLPKNKLASQIIKKLKVYETSEHPHSAQNPKELTLPSKNK